MAHDALTGINTRNTNQTEQARPDQVLNNAGGYVFSVNDLTRLRRFLILGTDGGTYYVDSRKHTLDNAEIVLNFARTNGSVLLNEVLDISESGRAPRQNQCIFALAAVMGLGKTEDKQHAQAIFNRVIRTAEHLFMFNKYLGQFKPHTGRNYRDTIAQWYTDNSADFLAYQVIKYRNRHGWNHRDLLRKAHPQFTTPKNGVQLTEQHKALLRWIAQPETANYESLPPVIHGYLAAQRAERRAEWLYIIDEYPSLPWEAFPDAALTDPNIWTELIYKGMPQMALLRNLSRFTRLGIFDSIEIRNKVAEQLQDTRRLVKSRVHPMKVLLGAATYNEGIGERGDRWTPNSTISDSLDAAFYNAFGAVHKTNKRHLLALDISGSMMNRVSSKTPIECRVAAAAMALVTAATEPNSVIVGFTGNLQQEHYRTYGYGHRFTGQSFTDPISELNISPRERIDDVVTRIENLDFGRTDCAQPALWALKNNHDFDAIAIYTDNESYAGDIHPYQALNNYRNHVQHRVKQIAVAMSATEYSIADPTDADSLDIVGFDGDVPDLIADHVESME